MRFKFLMGLACSFFVLSSCQTSNDNRLKEYMIGRWQTEYIKVEFETYNASDSTFVMEDRFENNPERIAQSEYFYDGTFHAWFLDRNQEKQGETSGKWSISNDTLFTSYFYLGKDVKATYKLTTNEGGFEAISLYDWDNDGKNDDLLLMKTKRIK